jgi:hypothetical protein
MKLMNKILSSLILLGCMSTTLQSKAQFLSDSNRRPMTEKKYVDISGSPYFSDLFLKGSVNLADGKHYDNMFLQFDQVQEKLLFKNMLNEEFPSEFTLAVAEFNVTLPEGESVKFKNLNSAGENKAGLYQEIYSGKVSLFKRTKKNIVQNASYNTANVEKRITVSTTYLIQTADAQLVPVKADKKAFLSVLSGKSKELEAYISKEKIDFKKDSELAKLMAYYNSL